MAAAVHRASDGREGFRHHDGYGLGLGYRLMYTWLER